MRIVGGRLGGRRLAAPGDRAIRPTAERTRQALFDMLAHGPYPGPEGPMPLGARMLDAFAGTGAVGLEALSRGAAGVTFLDSEPSALGLVRRNAAALAPEDPAVSILRRDATRPGRAPGRHDLAFLDPPHGAGLAEPALRALDSAGWLALDAVVVVECARKEVLAAPEGFQIVDQRAHGAARLVFLRRGLTRA